MSHWDYVHSTGVNQYEVRYAPEDIWQQIHEVFLGEGYIYFFGKNQGVSIYVHQDEIRRP